MERSHQYGDLLFETIAVRNGEIMHAALHHNRINNGMRTLRMPSTISYEAFCSEILNALKGLLNARVRFTVCRNGKGFYMPIESKLETYIEITELPEERLDIDQIGVYQDNRKSSSRLSNIKSGNGLVSVMAAIAAQEYGWADAVILNDKGLICEATSSNLFLIKQGIIVTPSLNAGCVDGIMRSVILELCKANGIPYTESDCHLSDLHVATEVFLTNAIHRIQRVARFEGKTYASETTNLLRQLLDNQGW